MGRTTGHRGQGAATRTRPRAGTGGAAGLVLPALVAGVLGLGVLGLPVAAGAAPAAPRACPESVLDRYEPGDEVTVVGYTAGCLAGGDVPGTSPAGVSGYLHADPCAEVDLPYCTPLNGPSDPTSGTPVGRFALTATTDEARGHRMELTFALPAGIASGLYYLVVCEDPCAPGTPGGLAATPLYVGVDPPPDGRPVRHWPLEDPAIAALPDDALVQPGDGRTLTGAEARGTAGVGGASGIDPTDVVTSGPEMAADRGAGDGEPWRPPGWALAVVLVVGIAAVGARRGRGAPRGADRKQVRLSR